MEMPINKDSLIVNFNPETNKIWYECLSSECGKNKTTDIGLFSSTDDEKLGANKLIYVKMK